MEASESGPTDAKPTVEQAMEVAQAAQAAALEAKTAAEARPAVATAVQEEASEQGITLSEEEVQKIANATITELEARGAFGPPAQTETPPPAAQDAAESPPAGGAADTGGGGSEAPSGSEAAPTDEPPAKRSLAERFQGRDER